MLPLERVLVPTDGSNCAARAQRHAVHLAAHFGAEVHLLYVEEGPLDGDLPSLRTAPVPGGGASPNGLSAAQPPTQTRRLVHRTAADGILHYEATSAPHLIVMGTHGRQGVERLLLGSVAETVVRHASAPVLTVPPHTPPVSTLNGGRLVVPVDFSSHRSRLLAHARMWARAYKMSLTLLHVVETEGLPAAYDIVQDPTGPDLITDRVATEVAEWAEPLRADGLEVDVDVRTGHAVTEILEATSSLDTDVLAISTHGRGGLRRFVLGSVAEKVVRHVQCPVLTVKAFDRSPDAAPA
jgi:nucleotide-binding universal stress UspA family protein